MKEGEREAAVLELLGHAGLTRSPKSMNELFSGSVLHEFFRMMYWSV